MKKNVVIIKSDQYAYMKYAPFRPDKKYPEYLWGGDILSNENNIYKMVREAFYLAGYDAENYNKKSWNPLGGLISKGDCVLVKPNMVMHENAVKENGTDCLYTQPSVVAAVIDYIVIALEGHGKIIVGDAPMQSCDFEKLAECSGYNLLINFYKQRLKDKDIKIEFIDFRGLKSKSVRGVIHAVETQVKGKVIDLGNESEFSGETEYFYKNMRITNYDPALLKSHHNQVKNEYFVSEYMLSADVIINMPKPKTHRKAGITASMKNMVGISCRKEYLPHHTNGSIKEEGDEYLNRSILKKILNIICDKRNYYAQTQKAYKKAWLLKIGIRSISIMIKILSEDNYMEGNWYGNDTISRTIVDLNKIILYADKSGTIQKEKQRKYIIIADMIISGEQEGPLAPMPKDIGIIALGEDMVCFDEVISELMGAKRKFIHTLERARNPRGEIKITESDSFPFLISNDIRWNKKTLQELERKDLLYFVPANGWEEVFKTKHN